MIVSIRNFGKSGYKTHEKEGLHTVGSRRPEGEGTPWYLSDMQTKRCKAKVRK